MFLGDAAQGGKLTKAGVGEDNVDSPPFRLDGFVEPIKVSQLGDVSLTLTTLPLTAFAASSNTSWPVMETYALSATKSVAAAKPIPAGPSAMTAAFL